MRKSTCKNATRHACLLEWIRYINIADYFKIHVHACIKHLPNHEIFNQFVMSQSERSDCRYTNVWVDTGSYIKLISQVWHYNCTNCNIKPDWSKLSTLMRQAFSNFQSFIHEIYLNWGTFMTRTGINLLNLSILVKWNKEH